MRKRARARARSLVEFRVQRPDLRFWQGIKGWLGRGCYSRARRFAKDIAVLKIEEDPPRGDRSGFYKPSTYQRNRWMIKGGKKNQCYLLCVSVFLEKIISKNYFLDIENCFKGNCSQLWNGYWNRKGTETGGYRLNWKSAGQVSSECVNR